MFLIKKCGRLWNTARNGAFFTERCLGMQAAILTDKSSAQERFLYSCSRPCLPMPLRGGKREAESHRPSVDGHSVSSRSISSSTISGLAPEKFITTSPSALSSTVRG